MLGFYERGCGSKRDIEHIFTLCLFSWNGFGWKNQRSLLKAKGIWKLKNYSRWEWFRDSQIRPHKSDMSFERSTMCHCLIYKINIFSDYFLCSTEPLQTICLRLCVSHPSRFAYVLDFKYDLALLHTALPLPVKGNLHNAWALNILAADDTRRLCY